MVAYFGNKTSYVPYKRLTMQQVYAVMWKIDGESCLMGIFSTVENALAYVRELEEKENDSLLETVIIRYTLDEGDDY